MFENCSLHVFLIKHLSSCFVRSAYYFFERNVMTCRIRFDISLYIMADSLVVPKSRQSLFEFILGITINFIDCFEILSFGFLDHVRTVGFAPFFFLLEKTQLSCLTKLCHFKSTYLRLLFKFQLSMADEEIG